MADQPELTAFRLDAHYRAIVADVTGAFGDPGQLPDYFNVWSDLTITPTVEGERDTPELRIVDAVPPLTLLLTPTPARIETGVLRLAGADAGVDGVWLTAQSDILDLPVGKRLLYTVSFGDVKVNDRIFRYDDVTFAAPIVPLAGFTPGVWTVTVTGAPTAGTFKLRFFAHDTTPIPYNAANSVVKAALAALPGRTAADWDVAGPPGGPWVITLAGAIARQNAALSVPPEGLAITGGTANAGTSFVPVVVDLTTVTRVAA